MNAWVTRCADAIVRHPRVFDSALAAVLLVAGLTWGLLEFRYLGHRQGDVLPPAQPTPLVVVAIVAVITPLAWRRRAPLTVLALVAAAQVAASALLHYENEITVLAVLSAPAGALTSLSPPRRPCTTPCTSARRYRSSADGGLCHRCGGCVRPAGAVRGE